MSRVMIACPPLESRIQHHDEGFMPFLGMGYIASTLRAAGHDVRVADSRLSRFDMAGFLDMVREFRPEVVGFSAMTHEIMQAFAAAREIKRIDPRTRVMVGGAHATAMARRTLEECEAIDLACVAEGEATAVDAVAAWANGGIDSCAGAVWRDDAGVIHAGPPRTWQHDLDAIPLPAWDLFPRSATYPIMSARGCHFRCNFCCRASGDKVRKRSPSHTLEELDWVIRTYRPGMVRFEDETLTWDHDHIHEILDGILERGHHRLTSFTGQTRVDRVDPGLLLKLKRANFVMLEMGVESGNPAILEASGKRIDIERVRESFRLAHQAGLKTWGKFILGHPNETAESIGDSIDLAAEINPKLVSFAIMVPYPGTVIWELATRGEGGYRMISGDWKAFDKFLGNALELENLPRRELEKAQMRAYATVYLRNHRYGDFAGLLWKHRKAAASLVRKVAKQTLTRSRPVAGASARIS